MGHKWTKKHTLEETDYIFEQLAYKHLEGVNHPLASFVRSAIRRKDYAQLCTLDASPSGFDSAHSYFAVAQALAFWKKRADLPGFNPRRAAQQAFLRAERDCAVTNDIFDMRSEGTLSFPPWVEEVLDRARAKIATVLGRVPSLHELDMRFGPGATTVIKKKDASARRKIAEGFQCSENFAHLSQVLSECPAWLAVPGLTLRVEDAKVSFVAKNAKTDRTIAVEPVLNSFVQLGFGQWMADRLKREGVDIRDQSRNQRLAKSGSIHQWLATIDLSSASDCLSYGLVQDLLPVDWLSALDGARSSRALYEGRPMRLHKFSSMGNGFTFPLQTLIFYALAWASQPRVEHGPQRPQVAVAYGDDIIVPVDVAPRLAEVLRYVGFRVNREKSFWDGPFRESCGKDYFLGVDVRPWFARDRASPRTLVNLTNYYVRNEMWDFVPLVVQFIPDWVPRGPDGIGDGHIVDPDWERIPGRREVANGWAGCWVRTFLSVPRRERYGSTLDANLAYALYNAYRAPGQSRLSARECRLRDRSGYLMRGYRVEVLEPADNGLSGIDGSISAPLPGGDDDDYRLARVYVL